MSWHSSLKMRELTALVLTKFTCLMTVSRLYRNAWGTILDAGPAYESFNEENRHLELSA